MIGDLRPKRQSTHRGRPPARQGEIDGGDPEPSNSTPDDGRPPRQHPLENDRPPDRDHEVNRNGGNKKRQGPSLVGQQQLPSGTSGNERIPPRNERVNGGRQPTEQGGDNPGPNPNPHKPSLPRHKEKRTETNRSKEASGEGDRQSDKNAARDRTGQAANAASTRTGRSVRAIPDTARRT
jgi:hypothetical protein